MCLIYIHSYYSLFSWHNSVEKYIKLYKVYLSSVIADRKSPWLKTHGESMVSELKVTEGLQVHFVSGKGRRFFSSHQNECYIIFKRRNYINRWRFRLIWTVQPRHSYAQKKPVKLDENNHLHVKSGNINKIQKIKDGGLFERKNIK